MFNPEGSPIHNLFHFAGQPITDVLIKSQNRNSATVKYLRVTRGYVSVSCLFTRLQIFIFS